MSRKVIRNKELTQKEADFYSNLDWKGKSKRLRKKANKILEHDCCLDVNYIKLDELETYGGWCYKCGTYYAECACK